MWKQQIDACMCYIMVVLGPVMVLGIPTLVVVESEPKPQPQPHIVD